MGVPARASDIRAVVQAHGAEDGVLAHPESRGHATLGGPGEPAEVLQPGEFCLDVGGDFALAFLVFGEERLEPHLVDLSGGCLELFAAVLQQVLEGGRPLSGDGCRRGGGATAHQRHEPCVPGPATRWRR